MKTKSLTESFGYTHTSPASFVYPHPSSHLTCSAKASLTPACPGLPASPLASHLLWIRRWACASCYQQVSLCGRTICFFSTRHKLPFPYSYAVRHLADAVMLKKRKEKKNLLTKWKKEKLTVTSGLDFQRVHGDLGSTWNFFSSEAYRIGSCAIHDRMLLGKAWFWIPTLFLFFD